MSFVIEGAAFFLPMKVELIDDIVATTQTFFDWVPPILEPGFECPSPEACRGKACLDKVHFNTAGRQEYLCNKMVYYYVPCFYYQYVSEIWYALRQFNPLSILDELRVVSLGCGAAPDLCAIDGYLKERSSNVPYTYLGLDANDFWGILQQIINAKRPQAKFELGSIEDLPPRFMARAEKFNMLILQYFLSALCQKERGGKIPDSVIAAIVHLVNEKMDERGFIIINDTNHRLTGRDDWGRLVMSIKQIRPDATAFACHFPRNKNCYAYGASYAELGLEHEELRGEFKIIPDIPDEVAFEYDPHRTCGSCQLIIRL